MTVRDLARARTEEAMAVIVAVMKKSKTDRARLAAAETLLAYGWGRPLAGVGPADANQEFEAAMQRLDAEFANQPEILARALGAIGGEPPAKNDLSKLSRDELKTLEALLAKAQGKSVLPLA